MKKFRKAAYSVQIFALPFQMVIRSDPSELSKFFPSQMENRLLVKVYYKRGKTLSHTQEYFFQDRFLFHPENNQKDWKRAQDYYENNFVRPQSNPLHHKQPAS